MQKTTCIAALKPQLLTLPSNFCECLSEWLPGKNLRPEDSAPGEWDHRQYSIPYDIEHPTNNGSLYSFHADAATPPVKRR